MSDEAQRIRGEYARRKRELPSDFYALHRQAMLFAHQSRERALRAALERAAHLPIRGLNLLEVGCGAGEWFASFERFGLEFNALAGIELDAQRLAQARARAPAADLREGDASRLPWADASFDLVFQSTVFSSILDEAMRLQIASEMRRVLRPGGAILWYDLAYDNPRNRGVRGLRARSLERLFPNARVDVMRVTLAPPLARLLVPVSWAVSYALETLRLLNSHLFAVIRF